ncbi:MAG: COG1470 family protein, partial [Thermoplasmatota archaeon]
DFEGNTVRGKAKDLGADGNATFDLVVKNLGSKLDPIRLLATTSESGWTTRILVDGVETEVVPLETNESAKFVLRVKAPAGLNATESAIAQVVVRATSGILASVRDERFATAQRLTASDLSLVIDDTFRFVDPGGNATFNLTLRNASEGVTVRLDARGSPAGGWKAPRIVTAEGVVPNGGRLYFGSALQVNVTVQAPANASAGLSTTVRFSARPDDNPPREAILTIRVRAVHAIEAVLPNLPLALSGVGQEQAVEVRLRNLGNLAEVLNVTVADLPSGWNLTVPPDIRLAVGASQTLRLGLKAPPGVPAGLYNITVGLLALDGNMTFLRLPTQVGSVARQRVDAVDGLPVQPGELAAFEVPVANEGNVPLGVTLQPTPGDAWRVRPLPETLLQPGEQATLLLLWEIPATAPDGGVTREARLAFSSEQGESRVQSVTARFDVGRPDLVLTGLTSTPAPAGTLVQATVRNQGTRPAHGFDVDLVTGGRVVDRAHVGELPANGTVVLSLLQTEAGSARVVADSNGTVVEGLESNNARDVTAEASKDAPALPTVPSLALLALAVMLARRRRPGPA